MIEFNNQIKLASGILNRCPSCMNNFVRHICEFTCSPRQSDFIKVVKTEFNPDNENSKFENSIYKLFTALTTYFVPIEEYIDEIDIYIADEYFNGAYDSCKHVIYPSTGQLALDLMCGEWGASKCSPARWFGSMGDANNPFVPFQINYLPQNSSSRNDDIKPLNPKVVPCNQSVITKDVRMFWHFLEIHSTLTQNFYFFFLFFLF